MLHYQREKGSFVLSQDPSPPPFDRRPADEKDRKEHRLRRLIPLTSDHSAWIELLAKGLGRRRERLTVSEGNETSSRFLDLLGAYARMSPGPGRRLGAGTDRDVTKPAPSSLLHYVALRRSGHGLLKRLPAEQARSRSVSIPKLERKCLIVK